VDRHVVAHLESEAPARHHERAAELHGIVGAVTGEAGAGDEQVTVGGGADPFEVVFVGEPLSHPGGGGEVLGEPVVDLGVAAGPDRHGDDRAVVDALRGVGHRTVGVDEVCRQDGQHQFTLALELLVELALLCRQQARHALQTASEIAVLVVAEIRQLRIAFALGHRSGRGHGRPDRAAQTPCEQKAHHGRQRHHDQCDGSQPPQVVVERLAGTRQRNLGDDHPFHAGHVDRGRGAVHRAAEIVGGAATERLAAERITYRRGVDELYAHR